MSTPRATGNRVGRPRKNAIDRQEFFGVFARMNDGEREYALDVMKTVHAALSGVPETEQTNGKDGESTLATAVG